MTTSGLTAFVWCKSDGVLNPKVVHATGCGASSLRFLHFWPCIPVQGPVEERKKNQELVTDVITSSLDYSQLFPISRQGCKENSVAVEYLPKEKGCLISVQQRKAWWLGQDAIVCHVSR